MEEQLSGPLRRLHAFSEQARALARHVPGGDFALRQARAAEGILLEELRWRLDQQNRDAHPTSPADGSRPVSAQRKNGTPAEALQALMERSLDQTADTAANQLYLRLLAQLLPDEARILAALSDGNPVPICHLEAGSRLGNANLPVMMNVSRVGKQSGVMLPANAPHYVAHLRHLELVEIGTEDKTQGSTYQMIESGSEFRAAIKHIEQEMNLRPKVRRATAYLSSLGHDLWQACQPEEGF